MAVKATPVAAGDDEHVVVVVPPGFSAGDEIIVSHDGYEFAAEVPDGQREGDEFEAYVGHIGTDADGVSTQRPAPQLNFQGRNQRETYQSPACIYTTARALAPAQAPALVSPRPLSPFWTGASISDG